MASEELAPLREYLRYYSAAIDEVSKPLTADAVEAARLAAVKSLPKVTLNALIDSGDRALGTLNESQLRDMFQDGHFHFVWKTTDAARRYLASILSLAKNVASAR
jgi:hypothetical protein